MVKPSQLRQHPRLRSKRSRSGCDEDRIGQDRVSRPRNAIVYAKAAATHAVTLVLEGSNIILRGRGIINGSLVPRGGRSLMGVWGQRLRVEGITVRDSCTWTCHVGHSDGVSIDNVKAFGWRGNSDGMDLRNSRNVDVRNCYLRTFDDLVVVKTNQKDDGPAEHIRLYHCVLWNEFAHALSLGAELRCPVNDVSFADCDVIHNKGREWDLRAYQCDSAPISNVTFENIRIEECPQLISL